MTTITARPLRVIAEEIKKDWTKPYFGAVPYLDAMAALGDIDERYGCDSAESIVLHFLANSGTWRGQVARRIKKELTEILG
ncbi:hypothetical protein [Mycobacteroides franklinii]|uniref:hypothetical protein n=1 Tax=Mycobacteroides franklinii TaxID=948102 RepID=UPI0013E89F62|nr:hypothetical protein [Mycobacteroides franklinii]